MRGAEQRESDETFPMHGRPIGQYDDIAVRHQFVRKVFGIVFTQLAITTMIAVGFMYRYKPDGSTNPGDIFRGSKVASILYIIPIVLFIAVNMVICCCTSLLRKTPHNYIIVFLYAIGMGGLVGIILCNPQYELQFIGQIFMLTTVIVMGLMTFAMQTKYDFSGMGPYLFVGVLLMCVMSIFFFLVSIWIHISWRDQFMGGVGALLFSMYLVYDTQLIVGGKHQKFQFSIDDYCFAALNLYIDIVNIFLYLLQLFGDR